MANIQNEVTNTLGTMVSSLPDAVYGPRNFHPINACIVTEKFCAFSPENESELRVRATKHVTHVVTVLAGMLHIS